MIHEDGSRDLASKSSIAPAGMPQINLMSSSVQRIDTLNREEGVKKPQFTVDRSAQREVNDEEGR